MFSPLCLRFAQFVHELSGALLGETRAKKSGLELLECGAEFAGLPKLIDAYLSGGCCHDLLELGVKHCQVKEILGDWRSFNLSRTCTSTPP